MKGVVFCVFLFAAAWALPKGQNESPFKRMYVDPLVDTLPKDLISRIVNGQEAVPHSIPYQAYLIISAINGLRWLCGGSLISRRHVLTAGHCLDGGRLVHVHLGVHNVREPESTQVIVESRNLIIHRSYEEDNIRNDIGVIVLNEPVELNKNIDTVALPRRGFISDYAGVNARVSGWGRVSGNGSTSPVLLEVNSTVITNAQCRQVFSIVVDSQLCISGLGGVGSCNGDSGGPLVYDNVLIGAASYGAAGCLSGYPSAFTRVSSYLDWLEEITDLTF